MTTPVRYWIAPIGIARAISVLCLALAGVLPVHGGAAEIKGGDGKPAEKVSYYGQIRPIPQANCQGCHQPAKSKGGYVMTDFKRLLAGGDTEGVAIVPA